MDPKREKAKEISFAVKRFMELSPKCQEELSPLVSKGAWTIMNIVELLRQGKTYIEIAYELNINQNTVKLYIAGLHDSGVFDFNCKNAATQIVGRPQKLWEVNL